MANRQEIVCTYIYENYVQFNRLRHDVISNKTQIFTPDGLACPETLRWRDITTADVNDIVCDCSAQSGLQITAREVLAVLQSHRIPDVHPLREYVLNCRPYTTDQPDWIAWLASRVTVTGGEEEQKLWVTCFRKWFVAMVASWLSDEVVNQQVLVLVGKQGIFKTTWLEHLLPPELRAYSCKMANSTQLNKDERLRIAEYGLIALDEIDAMGPRELNVMKSVITASDISERAAYGYTKERRIRLASFCASGNKTEFLTDITGNRRWLPFQAQSIANPFYITLPYEQIYAEAKYLIENDFQYWFDLDDIDELEAHNEDFRTQENEEQLLAVYFDIPAAGGEVVNGAIEDGKGSQVRNLLIVPSPEKVDPALAFASSEATATINEAFVAPVLNNPNGLAVSYYSEDPMVAIVNAETGEVTPVAAGTTTINAYTNGDLFHEAGEVSYTLTVLKGIVSLAFSAPTASVKVDATEFVLPILSNPQDVEVTYSSSNPAVANIFALYGDMTLVAAGTTTITATFAGDEKYLPSEASYVLTVEPSGDPTAIEDVRFESDKAEKVLMDGILYIALPDGKIFDAHGLQVK